MGKRDGLRGDGATGGGGDLAIGALGDFLVDDGAVFHLELDGLVGGEGFDVGHVDGDIAHEGGGDGEFAAVGGFDGAGDVVAIFEDDFIGGGEGRG